MLIEAKAFHLQEVGEQSFMEIKNSCLHDFARNLKEALTTTNSSIRSFWVTNGSIANYKIFQDNFGSKIKYNTKSIVFEETLYNYPNGPWSPKRPRHTLRNAIPFQRLLVLHMLIVPPLIRV